MLLSRAHSRRVRSLLLSVTALTAVCAPVVYAQDAAENIVLDEILVTSASSIATSSRPLPS